jgi:hypothetical protein
MQVRTGPFRGRRSGDRTCAISTRGFGSPPSRFVYAVSRAVLTRGDNGNSQANYSRLLGSISSGAISNSYRGRKDRGIGLVASTGAFHLASYAADNVLREFFFRTITSKLPGYQKNTSSESVSGETNSQTKEEPVPRQPDRRLPGANPVSDERRISCTK